MRSTFTGLVAAFILASCFISMVAASDTMRHTIATSTTDSLSSLLLIYGFLLILIITALPLLTFLFLHYRYSTPSLINTPARLQINKTTSKHNTTTDTDLIIIGAGVAGASLGASLAMRGYHVIVLEQSLSEPTRMVGEILQPSGCQYLHALGLGDVLNDIDGIQSIKGYSIFDPTSHNFLLNYPRDPLTHTTLEGRSFHNGRFLGALRRALNRACVGNKKVELRQGRVTKLMKNGKDGRVNGVEYTATNPVTNEITHDTLTAALTIVCDGLMSSFRSEVIENAMKKRSSFVGMILQVDDATAAAAAAAASQKEKVHETFYPSSLGLNIFLASPTPMLLFPLSNTEARLIVDFPADHTIPTGEKMKEHMRLKVLPQLPNSIHASFLTALNNGTAITTMPNMQLCARPRSVPGVLIIGDTMNIRHPLAGGGMTVALTDVHAIVKMFEEKIIDFNDEHSLDQLVQRHYTTRAGSVTSMNIIAESLYDVFSTRYIHLRHACCGYLAQNNSSTQAAHDSVSLLSGLSRDEMLLHYHFVKVAIFGIKQVLWRTTAGVATTTTTEEPSILKSFSSTSSSTPFSSSSPFPFLPSLHGLSLSYHLLRDACTIFLPLFQQEHPGLICSWIAATLRVIFSVEYKSYVFPQ